MRVGVGGGRADEIYPERERACLCIVSYIIVNFCRFSLFAYYFCLLCSGSAQRGARGATQRRGATAFHAPPPFEPPPQCTPLPFSVPLVCSSSPSAYGINLFLLIRIQCVRDERSRIRWCSTDSYTPKFYSFFSAYIFGFLICFREKSFTIVFLFYF